MHVRDLIDEADTFIHRHIGPSPDDIQTMLKTLRCEGLTALVEATVPASIRWTGDLGIGPARDEHALLEVLSAIAAKNQVARSVIGMGYYDTRTPPVIQRGILENPGWYTQYTPYQAEIAQGRLEALLNFQTMVADLTGLPLANASLLDEGTAAAEAMTMCARIASAGRSAFFVASDTHPQTIGVLKTRARPLGIEVIVGDPSAIDFADARQPFCGLLLSYPTSSGSVLDYAPLVERAHANDVLVVVATDLLALTLLRPPGEFGADIAIGSAQRFGVPLGGGGPHAAFLATSEAHRRHIPGRIVGVSKDSEGRPAYRLALQTREQHIRRDKATSNICTAQVLLAVIASMYAVYHGPDGLRRIAERIHALTAILKAGLEKLGVRVVNDGAFFDTLRVRLEAAKREVVLEGAKEKHINFRCYGQDEHDDADGCEAGDLGISLDETSTPALVDELLSIFASPGAAPSISAKELAASVDVSIPLPHRRSTKFLQHAVFNRYHAEHEMLRYLHRLESADLSLNTSMIPLGSCTMKLNAASEMFPVTWPQFARIHPFAPADQREGYRCLLESLERKLCAVTGFAACSLQPNAGSQGEYAGLLVIRAYLESLGQSHRDVCLIPTSAHGTNPASAAMVGFKVIAVACDESGNVDVGDLRAKAAKHQDRLAAMMITYPSTHGVFEEEIRTLIDVVHEHGGQVYMDGANLNAQVGLCRPGTFGADVMHVNLHKTFCIPHGGGGPGMGPIVVASHLAPFLPDHPAAFSHPENSVGLVSAAPYGSASILPISWMYIALMGDVGLKKATMVAILNANYMAERLKDHYEILYRGKEGRVAHEFILDMRPFKKSAGIEVEDIAKRLMDYGFHAPTMSFPVPGTLMVEPTESESLYELDRFSNAMIRIREEIRAIEEGRMDRSDNPLKNAPHTAQHVSSDVWTHPYPREVAAYPAPDTKAFKFWPVVGRVDNAYGDRHLVCTCPPMDAVASE
ncbi:MAG: aminomethyl-transferring glycine dehydrogenase [Deltaproteobacteria bacterium]|nr:aminomethyl-transferring glycine dehydrogenase [Deltaproteobacteria bacterium]